MNIARSSFCMCANTLDSKKKRYIFTQNNKKKTEKKKKYEKKANACLASRK
jgi:hypothetical protein